MHSEEELRQFGEWERAAWEQRAAVYAGSLGDLTRGSIGALLAAAHVRSGTRLLDVGTGPGFVALAAADAGAVVTAADQSQAMVDIARQAGVDAYVAGVEELPFTDGMFDAVVGSYLLNHLSHPERAVAELDRVLARSGRLAMTVWDVPAANPVTGLIGSVVTDLGLRGVVPAGPDSARFADDDELFTLLAGWIDVTVERPRWTVRVEPGAWFDAIADATPRTGAVLAQVSPADRARARSRYVDMAQQQYGTSGGLVDLPAGAVLVSASPPV